MGFASEKYSILFRLKQSDSHTWKAHPGNLMNSSFSSLFPVSWGGLLEEKNTIWFSLGGQGGLVKTLVCFVWAFKDMHAFLHNDVLRKSGFFFWSRYVERGIQSNHLPLELQANVIRGASLTRSLCCFCLWSLPPGWWGRFMMTKPIFTCFPAPQILHTHKYFNF